jgi:hypothetical protein
METPLTKAIMFFTGNTYTPSGAGDWIVLEAELNAKGVLPQEFIHWFCFERERACGLASLKFLNNMLSAIHSAEFSDWIVDRHRLAEKTIKSQIFRAATLRNCGLHVGAIAMDDSESFSPSFRLELALEYLSPEQRVEILEKYKDSAILELIGTPKYMELLPAVKEWIAKEGIVVML